MQHNDQNYLSGYDLECLPSAMVMLEKLALTLNSVVCKSREINLELNKLLTNKRKSNEKLLQQNKTIR